MFVLYNKNLNRYFKHPRIGVWWSHDLEEAEQLLQVAKEVVKDMGLSELADALVVQEVTDEIR
jgi:hypothetical protein